MQRTVFAKLSVGAAVSLVFNLTSVVCAQESGQADEMPEIEAVVGAPFSAVAVQENIRVTGDGNRFIHKFTSHRYRDGQGRTRLDRSIPVPVAATESADDGLHTYVIIQNKVTGEIDSLFPGAKLATVFQRPGIKVVDEPVTVPAIVASFAGMRLGAKDPGWSAPVSLGEKSIDGVHVVGTQEVYTVAAGKVGNEKPITLTVQQWSSPELGIIVDKMASASTGGQTHYHLTQLIQAEPDASLFRVPADYKKTVVDKTAAVTAVSTASATTTSAQ
jgi:hypothetical protein